MQPNTTELFLNDAYDYYNNKRILQHKNKQQPPKRFKPRQLTPYEKKQIQQRRQRFNETSKYRYESDENIDKQRKQRQIEIDTLVRNGLHSDKILIAQDGDDFAYKIVFENGDGFKPQKGFGVKYRFRSTLLDENQVHCQMFQDHMPDIIGRGRLPPLYDTIAMNTTKGQKGVYIGTSKYGYGDKGYFPSIPPYATWRVDYNIIDLRMKEFWQIGQVQKSDEIQLIFKQIQQFLEKVKNQPDMDFEFKKQRIYYFLYEIRLAEDRLIYSYTTRSDNCRKGVAAYQIYLVYHLGQKILAIQLMDKYFQLQGRQVDDVYVMARSQQYEGQLYRIKVQIQIQLGLIDQMRKDISDFQSFKGRSFYSQIEHLHQLLRKELQIWQNLSPQQKNEKQIKCQLRRQQLLQIDQALAPTECWIYGNRGYQPDHPRNKVQPVVLDKRVQYDKMFQWVIGKDKMHFYQTRLKDGWYLKIDWDRQQKYQEDLRLFLLEEDERQQQAQRKGQPFEPGFWVYKEVDQTWLQYDVRRRQLQLQHKYWKVHRQYGQKYIDFCIRREDIQKEQQWQRKYGLGELSDVQKKINQKMKRGFKDRQIPKMPRQQAYRAFNID